MEPTPPDPDNPYRSPQADLRGPVPQETAPVDPMLIRKFRQQIIALGAVWIILGIVGGGAMALALGGVDAFAAAADVDGPVAPLVMQITLAAVAVLGVVWVILGIFACLKQLWAVYTGLVLSYISLVGNVLTLNLCALVILIVIILQAHRVIGFAKRLRAAGVPLTAHESSAFNPWVSEH